MVDDIRVMRSLLCDNNMGSQTLLIQQEIGRDLGIDKVLDPNIARATGDPALLTEAGKIQLEQALRLKRIEDDAAAEAKRKEKEAKELQGKK